jgi:response regulator RpfG family c-di-GMP phosphodiesterase
MDRVTLPAVLNELAGASAPARSVLLVEDESDIREIMRRWLESGGYAVTTAASAEEALGHLEASPSAVALCDIRMPGRDGLWLAARIREQYPETAVIMASGVQDAGPAVAGLGEGVVDYLVKPFGGDRLREAVLHGLEWHRSAWDARQWRQTLEEDMQVRRSRLNAAIAANRVDSDETLASMLAMVTSSDRAALSHAYRVADLCVKIGRALQVPDVEIVVLGRAALLHDVGKLALPEAILGKPAPLAREEQTLVRLHPVLAADLLAQVPYLHGAIPLVRDANERMDASGYPRGVPAAGVALGARIIGAADAYDTMIHARVFRAAMSHADALLELERGSGSQFDPPVVAALQQIAAQ